MTITLNEPSADQQKINTYNRGMRSADKIPLETDQLYALCLLKLNNTVVPADYPTLKSAIEAVTGVQNISLIVDHHTTATVPSGMQLDAVVEINLRLDPTGI